MLILAIPVLRREMMMKARRSARLIRKVRTVTKDGRTYQQAFWMLPEQAEGDELPSGVQLDLFDQPLPAPEPPKVEAEPEPEEPAIYLSSEIKDAPDKVTAIFRTMAADMLAWSPPSFERVPDALLAEFRARASKYGTSGNAVEHFLDGLSFHFSDSWPVVSKKLAAVVEGERGVSMPNGITVKSKYHDLPFDDIVRLYAGWIDQGGEYRHKAWALYNELSETHENLYSAISAVDRLRDGERAAIAAGKAGFRYKAGTKTMIFKAAALSRTEPAEVPAGDPVDVVKALAARGVKTHEDAEHIGRVIYEAIGFGEDPDSKRIVELEAKQMALYDEYKRQWKKTAGFHRKPGETEWEADSRYRKTDNEYRAWMESSYKPQSKVVADEIESLKGKILSKSKSAPGEAVLEFMRKVRPMGTQGLNTDTMSASGGSEAIRIAKAAMSVFPAAWLAPLQSKPLVFKNGAGTCRGWEIVAQWKPGQVGHAKATQAHEIGHAVEKANGLGELCRQFAYSLADDENKGQVKSKRRAMRSWQKGIESPHLPDPYCGVLYDWGDTEVISMAAGALYEDYKDFTSRGARYWHFILGLWAGV